MAQKTPDAVLADSCRWVAHSTWEAAYRAAHDDAPAESDIQKRVEILVHDTDFIDLALRGNQWRNISRLLAAFAEAGTAGDPNVATFYTHTYYLSPGEEPPEHPERWKGKFTFPAPEAAPSTAKKSSAAPAATARESEREAAYNELLVVAAKLDSTRRSGGRKVLPHDTAAMHAVRLAASLLWPRVDAPAPPFPPGRTDRLVKLVKRWHDAALFPERLDREEAADSAS
ncbi:hypothetical protein OG206_31265 [Streptomyces sp. NBC_01341]|uniref:hypothetical protein n=1 Tax=Streptomyces sp. NBC_01341 TaxID=2903831 RepID=UPI002E0FB446|nr:hypothetical protein OG206_31265 [Streptomyces sp. NBC_01341]